MARAITPKAAPAALPELPIIPQGTNLTALYQMPFDEIRAGIRGMTPQAQAFLRVALGLPGDGLSPQVIDNFRDTMRSLTMEAYRQRAAMEAKPVAISVKPNGRGGLTLTFEQGGCEMVLNYSFSGIRARARGALATQELLRAVLSRAEVPSGLSPTAWLEAISKLTIPTLADIPAALAKAWEPHRAADALEKLKQKGILAALNAGKDFALVIPGYKPTPVSTLADASRLYIGTRERSPKPAEFPEGVLVPAMGGKDRRIFQSGLIEEVAG